MRQLAGGARAQLTQQTINESDSLVAIPPPQSERDELRRQCSLATAEAGAEKIQFAIIGIVLNSLQLQKEPGPSAWRNDVLVAIGRLKTGKITLQRWFALWTSGHSTKETARLWTAGVISPLDCGEKRVAPGEAVAVPPRRKLRPIGLSEVLIKTCESCLIEAELDAILHYTEPKNLGLAARTHLLSFSGWSDVGR